MASIVSEAYTSIPAPDLATSLLLRVTKGQSNALYISRSNTCLLYTSLARFAHQCDTDAWMGVLVKLVLGIRVKRAIRSDGVVARPDGDSLVERTVQKSLPKLFGELLRC